MVLCLLFRFPDKCLELLLHKGAFARMTWRMLAEQPGITHSLRCLETSVLEITSRKKLSNGHGSFQPKSTLEYNNTIILLIVMMKRNTLYFHSFFPYRFGLPADRLWVSVYNNDDEAFKIWHDEVNYAGGHQLPQFTLYVSFPCS